MSKLTDNTNRIQGLLNDISALPKDRYEEGLAVGGAKFRAMVDGSITEITAEDLAGVTKICPTAFAYCYGLTSITIPDSVTSIGAQAFGYCKGLISLVIPDSVTVLEGNICYECYGLTSITFPNNITELPNGMMYNCRALQSATIPSKVKTISTNAFYGCRSLTSIIIPSMVTSISSTAFGSCTSLMSITVKAVTPPKIQSNTFGSSSNSVPADCAFYVPAESVEAYKTATNWSKYADRIFAIEE